jgi:hypothetical protein
MSKERQRLRKKNRNKVTHFIEIPKGVVLKKFRVTVDGKPIHVKAISNNKIILAEAPPLGAKVLVERIQDEA